MISAKINQILKNITKLQNGEALAQCSYEKGYGV